MQNTMKDLNLFRRLVPAVLLLLAPLAQADDSKKYSDYIAALEDTKDKHFKEIIIAEIENYIHLFADSPSVDSIHFKLATLYHDDGDEINSFFTHMELLYLYPESEVTSVCKDRLRFLLQEERKFAPLREVTGTLLNPSVTDSSRDGASFHFLQAMQELRFSVIQKPLIRACGRFMVNFPSSENTDKVLFWRAELSRDKKPHNAMADYLKLINLHDRSLYVTASMLELAELYSSELKDHDQAIVTLHTFLQNFPDDPQAPQAQVRIAEIEEGKKKQYRKAITEYLQVVAKYPKSLEAAPALFAAAKLHENKFREYEEAIKIYLRVVEEFPGDLKAPYAFAEAAEIYEKRLKDYGNAASVYFKIYGNYPESSIAAESLFAAAEINEKRLEDFDKAVMYYRFVVDKYPDSRLALKANRRLEKLTRQAVKE